MATQGQRPLWLRIEDKILEYTEQDFSEAQQESLIQQIAAELELKGGGQWMHLRKAVTERLETGSILMKQFNESLSALTLEDVMDTYHAMMTLTFKLGETWPRLKESQYRPDVQAVIEELKLDLQIAKSKELGGQKGVRFMIEQAVDKDVILKSLEISEDEYEEVNAVIEAEQAEIARVRELIDGMDDKPPEEQVKKLLNSDVSEDMILKVGSYDHAVLDGVKKDIEAELEEKRRKEEEEAARRKAEAEGPALEEIPADEMLEHIEAIREILEFSDKEKEIRVMCEQSSIPKALVDIAVSEPDKLDELEKQAEDA
jgi:hypothetical protein